MSNSCCEICFILDKLLGSYFDRDKEDNKAQQFGNFVFAEVPMIRKKTTFCQLEFIFIIQWPD